jgi:hypothetical protein
MLVRLEPAIHPALKRVFKTNAPQMAPLFQYLLTPIAFVGYVLAFWRLGADLNWTGEFFITSGLLSHWQVWLALAIATQIAAAHLARYRNTDDILP